MTLRALHRLVPIFLLTLPGVVRAEQGDGAKGGAQPNPPRFAVCEGEEEGATCTFGAQGAQKTGSCVKRGLRMFCKLEPMLPPKMAEPEAEESGE